MISRIKNFIRKENLKGKWDQELRDSVSTSLEHNPFLETAYISSYVQTLIDLFKKQGNWSILDNEYIQYLDTDIGFAFLCHKDTALVEIGLPVYLNGKEIDFLQEALFDLFVFLFQSIKRRDNGLAQQKLIEEI